MNNSFGKCLQVVNSCTNEAQLLCAMRYVKRYIFLDNRDGWETRGSLLISLINQKNRVINNPSIRVFSELMRVTEI